MSKVVHITNKAEAFINAVTIGLCEDQMHFAVTKINAERAKELVKDQHVVVDIDTSYYQSDKIKNFYKNQIEEYLGIPDIEEDELNGQIEDVNYNFDDVILFIDLDYNGSEWKPTYYQVDILI